MMKQQWVYLTYTHPDSVYSAIAHVNREHPTWDIVSIMPNPYDTNMTIVIHRTPLE